MVWLTDARAPEGLRLYAIGDVHGCLGALRRVHDAILADLEARPPDDFRVIHLGDYVDRGPDSRGVIDWLVDCSDDERVVFLRGNHDQMFAGALAGDRRMMQLWLSNGGIETLESYGVVPAAFMEALAGGTPPDMVPDSHRAFLDRLTMYAAFGDYYFVHAGVDPRLPLDAQDPEALLWIRDPFLTSDAEFEAVIVHGHTPVPRVAVQQNRIGIDTGAVFGGTLSCLVLEGGQKWLLSDSGRSPLRAPDPAPEPLPHTPPRTMLRALRERLPLFGRG